MKLKINFHIKMLCILAYLMLVCNCLNAQTVNLSTTNLPIIIVDTESTAINETYKVGASMKIVYRGDGQTTFINDQNNLAYIDYDGRVGISIRGSSSADFAKKQYSFEMWDANDLPNPDSVLGLPQEHDWILQAPYIDKTLMRNVLAYQISNEMGQYASRTKFCELILDGDYKGVYVFMERIKQDDDRVDVEELDDLTDNTYPKITGGYVWKVDKGEADNSDGFVTAETDRYRFHDPLVHNLSTAQKNYLETEVESFEAIMNSANYAHPTLGYASKIDVSTWVDQFLLQEFTRNPDSFGSSMYYHKYRNGKLRMGPIWDLNLALGASYHGFAHYTYDWTTTFGHALIGPSYNQKLFNDPTFQCLMNERWFELRQPGMPLHINSINARIDSIYTLLNAGAQQRNFTKWNNLGVQVWLEAPGATQRDAYEKEIDYMKDWIIDRLVWMDSNMPDGTCPASVPNGLVINEIMYHPDVAINEIEGDYEYIEIYNNGNSTINLAGIQFSMGIHYTFTSGSIAPGQFVVLAGNSVTFQQRYGFAPFGQFEGGISNSGEHIILADTYGNILDEVDYKASSPWSVIADGQGPSLELINPSLDNNDSANWFSNFGLEGSAGNTNVQVAINCNPAPPQLVINEINYNSNNTENTGDWVEIYNASGSSVSLNGWTFQDNGSTFNFPSTTIAAGAYLVVAQELVNFATYNPSVSNVIGETGFSFSNGGETLSLFDERGCLVDVVTYDDVSPWVTEPDGSGPTLQLDNFNADNTSASNWSASSSNGGNPGQSNGGANGGGGSGIQIKVLLEGFYNASSGLMNTGLLVNNLLPTTHPYGQAPFYYFGGANVSNFPANTVDWVLLEVRSLTNPATVLERKPVLLRNDGFLMEVNGSTKIDLNTTGSNYLAIYHKSHMGVLSSGSIQVNGTGTYDFTTGVSKADGFAQQKTVGSKATMFSGDYDSNGLINNLDYNVWSSASAAINQYLTWDADGNGIVNNLDFNLWDSNKSKVGILEIQL